MAVRAIKIEYVSERGQTESDIGCHKNFRSKSAKTVVARGKTAKPIIAQYRAEKKIPELIEAELGSY